MAETAQQSQEKYVSDSSAIFAFAIRRHDYFNVYAEFFTYSARFNYSFSRRGLDSVISQIDQALASGEHYFCVNGRKYPVSAKLLQELRKSLSVVSNGGSDAQVSESGANDTQAARPLAEKQASAQALPARQISKNAEERNFEAEDDLKENYSFANSKGNHLQNSSPSILAAASTHDRKYADARQSTKQGSQNVFVKNLLGYRHRASSAFFPIHTKNGRTSVVIGSRKL